MHSKGANIREIPSSSPKDGELLQGIHSGIQCIKNSKADDLVKLAACNTPMTANVFFQVLENASVKTVLLEPRVINIIEGEDWRAPIMAYLRHYYEPDCKNEQTRMHQRAKQYQIVGKKLYKTSVSGPLLRCISKTEGQEII
jgi:hypothetical protein